MTTENTTSTQLRLDVPVSDIATLTPVSAILRMAGVDIKLRRPKGAKGRVVTDWLRPEDAAGIVQAADTFDAEFVRSYHATAHVRCPRGARRTAKQSLSLLPRLVLQHPLRCPPCVMK
jgi:hypothetical protein